MAPGPGRRRQNNDPATGVHSRMRARWLISYLLALACLAFDAREAAACSCPVRPACQQLFPANRVVFEGTVAAVERAGGMNIVRFRDIEPLRGVSSTTVRTWTDEGSCGVGFTVGTRYVVDASRDATGLFTPSCSLTSVAEDAVELKRFIRGLRRPGPGAHVAGTVTRWNAPLGPELLGGLTVALEGPGGVVTTTTADDGTFRFEKLRPGDYRLAVVPTADDPFASPAPATFHLPNAHACWQGTLPFRFVEPPAP